jgi:DNA-binding response OmpR family regulator
MRLLVAEADRALAESLQSRFQQEHFSVQLMTDSEPLSLLPENSAFALVLLDTNFAGPPGGSPLRGILRRWPHTPVILLSGETAVEERVRGLNNGADDFVVKPFAFAELLARANAILRRGNRPSREVFIFEDLEVNRVTHGVRRGGRAVELSPKEYALLEYLLRNAGHPISRSRIIEEVWQMEADRLTNVVDVYINYLRHKIDAGSERPLIRTIRGVGYQIGGNQVPG